MIYECTIIKMPKSETLHIVFHNKTKSKTTLKTIKQLMVTNTANRPSHEREKHTKIIITNKSEP